MVTQNVGPGLLPPGRFLSKGLLLLGTRESLAFAPDCLCKVVIANCYLEECLVLGCIVKHPWWQWSKIGSRGGK